MADNIVGGLFGMMPEDVAAQRMATLDQQAQAFGRMSSGEAYKTLGYKAGNLLGQGLFGVNDPQMERINQRQQMAQGIDWNDPESLLKAAQGANQAGDTRAAQTLYAKAVEMRQAQADLGKTKAETEKALREQQPEKIRIAQAYANSKAKPGTPEWDSLFQDYLDRLTEPKTGSTQLSAQERAIISDIETALESDPTGASVPTSLKAQARFILANKMQSKTYQDNETGKIIRVPGADVNNFAPRTATLLFGATQQQGGQPQAAGQPPMAPQGQPAPTGVTALETPNSIAKKEKEVDSVKSSVTSLNADLANVEEAIKRTTPWATGWGNYFLGGMPNTEALALNDIVTSINGAKVLTELGKLKEQSKTGASGLGSVTEREISLLEARIRSLNPKSKTFPEDLKYIQKTWIELRNKMQTKQGQTPSASPTTMPKSDEDIIARAMAHPSAQGFTREQVISGLRKSGRIK